MNLLALLAEKGVISPSDRLAFEGEIKKKRLLITDVLHERGIEITDALKVASDEYGIPFRILGDPLLKRVR
jgi:hypothetical protein